MEAFDFFENWEQIPQDETQKIVTYRPANSIDIDDIFDQDELGQAIPMVIGELADHAKNNKETPILVKYATLFAHFQDQPTSHYAFTHYLKIKKMNTQKMVNKIHMALLMTQTYKFGHVLTEAKAPSVLDSVLLNKATKTFQRYQASYSQFTQFMMENTDISSTDPYDALLRLIYEYEAFPIDPLRMQLPASKISVYDFLNQDTVPSHLKDRISTTKLSRVETPISDDPGKNPLILVENKKCNKCEYPSYSEQCKSICKERSKLRYDIKSRDPSTGRYEIQPLFKKAIPADRTSTHIQNNPLMGRKFFLLYTDDYDGTVELFKKNGVFCLYFGFEDGNSLGIRHLHAFALLENDDTSILKGGLYTILSRMKNKIPATMMNITDYILSQGYTRGDIYNWTLGLNLNGTKLCRYYLEHIGINIKDYDLCYHDININGRTHTYIDYKEHAFHKILNYRLQSGLYQCDYTNSHGKTYKKINFKSTKSENPETLPSKIYWSPNYGRDICTKENCNCYFATEFMLKTVDLSIRNRKTHRYNHSHDRVYTMYQQKTRTIIPDEDFTFEQIEILETDTCRHCGHETNTKACIDACAQRIKNYQDNYQNKLKIYIDALERTHAPFEKDKEIKKDCTQCPIFLLNTIDTDKMEFNDRRVTTEIREYYRNYDQEWIFGDNIKVNWEIIEQSKSQKEKSTYIDFQRLVVTLLGLANSTIVVDDIRDDVDFLKIFFDTARDAVGGHKSADTNILRTMVKSTLGISIIPLSEYFEKNNFIEHVIENENNRLPTNAKEIRQSKSNAANEDIHLPCFMCECHSLLLTKYNNVYHFDQTKQRSQDPGFNNVFENDITGNVNFQTPEDQYVNNVIMRIKDDHANYEEKLLFDIQKRNLDAPEIREENIDDIIKDFSANLQGTVKKLAATKPNYSEYGESLASEILQFVDKDQDYDWDIPR